MYKQGQAKKKTGRPSWYRRDWNMYVPVCVCVYTLTCTHTHTHTHTHTLLLSGENVRKQWCLRGDEHSLGPDLGIRKKYPFSTRGESGVLGEMAVSRCGEGGSKETERFVCLQNYDENISKGTEFYFILFYFILIFFNVYLFLRQREMEHERGRVRERGRHRIWSRLQALSCQHRARRGAQTHGPWDHDLSWSQTLSHPGAPISIAS